MRSIKLLVALSALSTLSQAQPFTGQSFYDHAGTPALLSSGTHVTTNPGFVMIGYKPTQAGFPNLYADKVAENGKFTGAPGEFSTVYKVLTGGTNCTAALNQEITCSGASIIETPTGGSILYGTASAYASGCLFATLKDNGNIVSNAFYNFPNAATNPSKPVIAAALNGDYYVCGSYDVSGTWFLYAFRITAAGATVWTQLYNAGIGNVLVPGAILEDTYSGTADLAVFGYCNTGSDDDGFFMKLKGNTGTLLVMEGIDSGSNTNERFFSAQLAISNNGYIVGGSTDVNSALGSAWMVRLNASGSVDWSSQIEPSTNNNAGDVIGVVERFSAFYGASEYYGLAQSFGGGGGMLVLKLDDTGAAFSASNNEFLYNDGAGNIGLPAAISYIDGGSTNNNTGIHVFGTRKNGPSDFFLAQAFFNGACGSCPSTAAQNLTNVTGVTTGPMTIVYPQLNLNTGLTQCGNFFVSVGNTSYAANQPCTTFGNPGSPYSGDNSRTSHATSIAETSMDEAGALAVYPNPVSTTAKIVYNAANGGAVKIDLFNCLGQHIVTLDEGHSAIGVNALNIDMSSMDLKSGVYLVNVTVNGTTSQQKMIVDKN